jgi:vancomycin permeability regulator SanA
VIDKKKFELLNRYLSASDQPEVVDLIFVFGGISMPKVWQKTLELYEKGFAKKIYIAGGVGEKSKADKIETSEAETIKAFLVERGVPNEAVVTETESTNTLENILNAKEILQPAKKLIAISKPFHMRRTLATFAKHYPQLTVLCCPPELEYEKLNDDERKYYFERMRGEIDRLVAYAKKGDIAPQEIPEDVLIKSGTP